jgi:hypothetical protein
MDDMSKETAPANLPASFGAWRSRRSVLKGAMTTGLTVAGAGLLAKELPAFADAHGLPAFADAHGLPASADAHGLPASADEGSGLTRGDAAILRLLAAVELIESDLWQQYNELGGIQDSEVPALKDPKNGLVFPDLNVPPLGGQDVQTNLIMPEPTIFLSRRFPAVAIIRPTQTQGSGGAVATVRAFTANGLFIGQSPAFFAVLNALAAAADAA